MLVQSEKISTKEFLQEFTKRFTNFCNKAPILISFKTTPTSVFIHNEYTKEIKVFQFDFTKSVKANIRKIKDWLVETQYPVMIQIKVDYEDYDVKEIKEKIDNEKVDIDNLLTSKKVVEETIKWRIERVIVRRDEFFVRNLNTNQLFRYKLKMPCILFLKKFREKLSPFEAWDLFERKSELLEEIEEITTE